MNQDKKIAGHQKQIDFLNKSIHSDKLAHAYLFTGPAYVGKRTVAARFVQTLLCEKNAACGECAQCKTFVAASNADYITLGAGESIKIEEIRDLIYKMSLKPYSAKYKIAVIDNAENMTVEAQNALLKVLEEAKPYTILILITANSNRLLQTIISRTQKINFGPVRAETYGNLIPAAIAPEARELILTLAAGRPGLAIRIASDEEMVARLSKIEEDYRVIRSPQLAEKLKLAYDLADLETAELRQVLDFWMIKFQQELAENPEKKSARDLMNVNQARKYLDQNVNTKLLLTNLMLSL